MKLEVEDLAMRKETRNHSNRHGHDGTIINLQLHDLRGKQRQTQHRGRERPHNQTPEATLESYASTRMIDAQHHQGTLTRPTHRQKE